MGLSTTLSSWARTNGVHILATRPTFVLILIIIIGTFFHARSVRGQSSPNTLSQAVGNNDGAVPGNEPAKRDLDGAVREFRQLRQAQPRTGGGQEIDRLKEQVDLQQKQIDVLLKMTQLLAEQLKKQPASGAVVDKLQEQVATQEASILRGASATRSSHKLTIRSSSNSMRRHRPARRFRHPFESSSAQPGTMNRPSPSMAARLYRSTPSTIRTAASAINRSNSVRTCS